MLSFTRAADELNLTQGAVSRQIKNLEEGLGVQLFQRQKKALRLTEEALPETARSDDAGFDGPVGLGVVAVVVHGVSIAFGAVRPHGCLDWTGAG